MTRPYQSLVRPDRPAWPSTTIELPEAYAHYTRAFSAARQNGRLAKKLRRGRTSANRGWTVITLKLNNYAESTSDVEMPNLQWRRLLSATPGVFRSTDITLSDGQSVLIGLCDCDKRQVGAATSRLRDSLANHLGVPVEGLADLVCMEVQSRSRWCPKSKSAPANANNVFEVRKPRVSGSAEVIVEGNHRVFKRVLDIVVASLIILLTLPLCLLIALGIKLSSRGPVFFLQKRLGLHGVPFTMLKFRTMRVDADEQVHRQYMNQFIANASSDDASSGSTDAPPFKLHNDGRILAFGQVLRRWSLDELPQLINVLTGDMSLVGPRPSVYYELESYLPWHHQRLEVKPGLTGMWQVHGRGWSSFDHMTRLDIQYIRSWSVLLDLKLLLFTAPAVLSRRGAA